MAAALCLGDPMQQGLTCPLGHTCEQCLWRVKVTKEHIQTGEVDVFHNCAIVVIAEQAGEQAKQIYSLGAAVESQRNVSMDAASLLAHAISETQLPLNLEHKR